MLTQHKGILQQCMKKKNKNARSTHNLQLFGVSYKCSWPPLYKEKNRQYEEETENKFCLQGNYIILMIQ